MRLSGKITIGNAFLSLGMLAWTALMPAPTMGQTPSGNMGDPYIALPGGNQALRNKTVADNIYNVARVASRVIENVDVITGKPAFHVPIGVIDHRDQVAFPISLTYNGNTDAALFTNNQTAPSGIIGLGWRLTTEAYIAVNHKGTLNFLDDVYFCSGPFGSGQIIRNSTGKYYLVSNPLLVFTPEVGEQGDVVRWRVLDPANGRIYSFGGSINAVRTQRVLNGLVVQSNPFVPTTSSGGFAYRWDLDTLIDKNQGSNKILFTYSPVTEDLGGGVSYTRESQVSEIKVLDIKGDAAERYEFQYATLAAEYFVGYAAGEPKTSQRPYSTSILSRINHYQEGILARYMVFNYLNITAAQNFSGAKKLLYSIDVYHPILGGEVKKGSWNFDYSSGENWMLSKATSPEGKVTQWSFTNGPDISQVEAPGTTEAALKTMKYKDGNNVLQPVWIGNDQGTQIKTFTGSFCNDQFCFLTASRREETSQTGVGGSHSLFVEVWENSGNRFAQEPAFRGNFSTSIKWDPTCTAPENTSCYPKVQLPVVKPIPDGFLVIYPYSKTVDMYKWNGSTFEKHGPDPLKPNDPLYQGTQQTGGTRNNMSAASGSNFVVVMDNHNNGANFRAKVRAFVKNSTGRYQVANIREIVNGVSRTVTTIDAEVPTNSNMLTTLQSHMVSAGNTMFAILSRQIGNASNIERDGIRLFKLRPDGLEFEEITSLLSSEFRDHVISTGGPSIVAPPIFMDDYFLIQTAERFNGLGLNNTWVSALHYDGSMIRKLGFSTGGGSMNETFWWGGGAVPNQESSLDLYANNDYFLMVNHSPGSTTAQGVRFCRKRFQTNILDFQCYDINPGNMATDSKYNLRIKASVAPSGFFLAYWDPINVDYARNRTNYDPYKRLLYRVDKTGSPVPITDLPGSINVNLSVNHIEFSPDDDMMIVQRSNGTLLSFQTNPGAGTNFLEAGQPITLDNVPTSGESWSFPGRYFCRSYQAGGNVNFRLYHNNGFNYLETDRKRVVASVEHQSGVEGVPPLLKTFIYPSTQYDFAFNSQSLAYQFSSVEILNPSAGRTVRKFRIDHPLSPLAGSQLALHGVQRVAEEWSAGSPSPFLLNRTESLLSIMTGPGWPSQVGMPIITSTTSLQRTSKGGNLGGEMVTTTNFLRHNPVTGIPHFVERHLNIGTPEDKWMVDQTIPKSTTYDPATTNHLSARILKYAFPTAAAKGNLTTAPLNAPLSGSYCVSQSRLEYNPAFPYSIDRASVWRDHDEVLSYDEMKNGIEPVLGIDENNINPAEVTRRSSTNRVHESARILRQGLNTKREYTSFFYEGRHTRLIGKVINSVRRNTSIVTAENGALSGTLVVDEDGKWQSQALTHIQDTVHTGRYSYRATNVFSLVADFYLENVPSDKFDFIASAWLFVPTGSAANFSLDRRSSLNTPVTGGTATGTPVDGPIRYGTWQRWEARIPYASLILGGLFASDAGSQNHVRVHIGLSSGSRIYVDDIVCRPSTSTFGITTFDAKGLVSSVTDTRHYTQYPGYDFEGKSTTITDVDFRSTGQSAYNERQTNWDGGAIRQYNYTFPKGNLIGNWSFENRGEGWLIPSGSVGGLIPSVRYQEQAFTVSPASGRYVAAVTGNGSGSGSANLIVSKDIRVKPGTPYVLSFKVWALNAAGTNYPIVNITPSTNGSGSVRQAIGTPYSNSSGWVTYSMTFSTLAGENSVKIYLFNTTAVGSSKGPVYFDDVVLEEGASPSNPDLIQETISYFDGIGRPLETQTQSQKGAVQKYIVSGNYYNADGRTNKSVIPFPTSGFNMTWIPNLESRANDYFQEALGRPEAGSFAFSEFKYAPEPSARVIETGEPGQPWAMPAGKVVKEGYYFVNSLSAVPANIESPTPAEVGTKYKLDWKKDANGNYSLQWSNEEGNLVQAAANSDKPTGFPHSSWTWAKTRMEYYRSGRLKKTLTPLDVASATDNFRKVSNYTAQGNVSSTYSGDEGVEKYWYSTDGMLRFSQNALQNLKNEFRYRDYDAHGRMISQGIQKLPAYGIIQDFADERATASQTPGDKIEISGFLFDSLARFTEKTGFSLADLGLQGIVLTNTQNKLVCSFRWNRENLVPSFTTRDKFVASFYSYDLRGNIESVTKFAGPVRTDVQKRHQVRMTYDLMDRPVRQDLYRYVSGAPVLLTTHLTEYDLLGRVSRVHNGSGRTHAKYAYFDWGPLQSVTLGANDAGTEGIRVDYVYNIRGWLTAAKATHIPSGKIIHEEMLGYDARAANTSQLPMPESRYDGSISQVLYRYADELNTQGAVRALNYSYDPLGRLVDANFMKSDNPNPLIASTLAIDWPNLSLLFSSDRETEVSFDLNGRITHKSEEGAGGGSYAYQANSYRLDKVVGAINPSSGRGDMGNPGTFQYDDIGRMVRDNSKKMQIFYGQDDLPVRFEVEQGSTLSIAHQFYDADGNRMAKISTTRDLASFRYSFLVGSNESGEPDNTYDFESLNEAVNVLSLWVQSTPVSQLPVQITLNVVPARGTNLVQPAMPLTIQPLEKDGFKVSLQLQGYLKDSPAYLNLIKAKIEGIPQRATHYVNLYTQDREIQEVLTSTWGVSSFNTTSGLVGASEPVGRILNSGQHQYFVKDHLGSTVRVSTTVGTNFQSGGWAFEYLPFGTKKTVLGSTEIVTPTFTGKEFEVENGLGFFGARNYDPELSVWTSPDPIRESFNPYMYVGGDPVNYTDPDGRSKESVGAGAIKFILGLGYKGQKQWKNTVKALAKGGTIERVAEVPGKQGRILSQKEAETLLDEAGATIDRIESYNPAHKGPSIHTYDHINYHTKDGTKGTVRIQNADVPRGGKKFGGTEVITPGLLLMWSFIYPLPLDAEMVQAAVGPREENDTREDEDPNDEQTVLSGLKNSSSLQSLLLQIKTSQGATNFMRQDQVVNFGFTPSLIIPISNTTAQPDATGGVKIGPMVLPGGDVYTPAQ